MLDINREIKQARNTKQWNFLSIALQRIQDELNGTTAIATKAATNAAALVSAAASSSASSAPVLPTAPGGSNPTPHQPAQPIVPSGSVPVVAIPPFGSHPPFYPLALDLTGTPVIDLAANGHMNKSADSINDGYVYYRMPVSPSVSAIANVSIAQSGTTTAINVSAGSYYLGLATTLSANSGSVDPGAYGTYYVYFDDPTYQGGAEVYQATTDITVLTQSPGRFPVAVITTSSSGGAIGGNITLTSANITGFAGVNYAYTSTIVTASIATTVSAKILTASLTLPATGGPWRILVYSSFLLSCSGSGIYEAWITDGTNILGAANEYVNTGPNQGLPVPVMLPPTSTYANGQVVPVSLYIGWTGNGTVTVNQNGTNFGKIGTWMQCLAIPSA